MGSSNSENEVRLNMAEVACGATADATGNTTGAPTKRQQQVLNLLAQGCRNKHIARELNIAERTVKMHITALLGLVGATNRTHLVVIAGARGLL